MVSPAAGLTAIKTIPTIELILIVGMVLYIDNEFYVIQILESFYVEIIIFPVIFDGQTPMCGRYAKERCRKAGTKPGTFTFLGFTHYCSKSRNGRFRVKRKTSKKKFAKKCREVNFLLVKMRTCKLKEIIAKLNQILTGYYHYYGITDNTESITAFRYNIMRSLFYCLNRRSQKKSYNWVEFLNMLDNSYPLVRPRIYVNIYE